MHNKKNGLVPHYQKGNTADPQYRFCELTSGTAIIKAITHACDDGEEKNMFWSMHLSELISNRVVLQNNQTARVRRLDDNSHYRRGFLVGDDDRVRQ
jgi:hypothetical protein